MDDFSNLLILCALMFVLTYFIGYLPMICKLSERKLESISIFGAGFLLGTALIVIVPEGLSVLMETSGILQANHEHHHHHDIVPNNIDEAIHKQLTDNMDTDIQLQMLQEENAKHTHRMLLIEHEHEHKHNNNPIILVPGDSDTDTEPIDEHSDEHHHTHTHDPIVHSVFRKMGCFVCFGFIFMMMVEKLSAHSHSHGHSYHHKDRDLEEKEFIEKEHHHHHHHNTMHDNVTSFMIGLLTHSAVDGIALGAVSAEGNAHSLSLLVFVALMAHKGPAAISMTAFLKRKSNEQKSKQSIIKQLIAFSSAAPLFSIITYLILTSITYFIGDDDDHYDDESDTSQMLGYCLLFSGGTFLYVVTLHIMPEIKEWRSNKESNNDDSLYWADLILLVIGCVAPSLFEHSH